MDITALSILCDKSLPNGLSLKAFNSAYQLFLNSNGKR